MNCFEMFSKGEESKMIVNFSNIILQFKKQNKTHKKTELMSGNGCFLPTSCVLRQKGTLSLRALLPLPPHLLFP